MNDASGQTVRQARAREIALAMVTGVWLALLQSAYFFLLEVRLSSRAGSFFVALFCWLVGFLVGLNVGAGRHFARWVGVAAAGYYAAYLVLEARPYEWAMLPIVALCIATGGAAAGAFFPALEPRFGRVKALFLHENNGYLLGLLAALLGCVFAGRTLLVAAPALGAAAVWVLWRATSVRN